MKFINTVDAEGHILCHDHTRIVKEECKEAVFRKGHVVTKEDIPVLLSMGKQQLYIWEKQPGMLHENEAADILYGLCAGENMHPTPVKEGKIEAIAAVDGLLLVDVEKLRAINSLGDMMIATRHNGSPVQKGDKLAGTRVIPLVIAEEKMKAARVCGGIVPILRLHPYTKKRVAVVTTGSEIANGLIEDTFTPVLIEKIQEYGSQYMGNKTPGDDPAAITTAIQGFLSQGADMVLCSGGMSVDPDDKTPLAIKNTGARVVSYGAPVLPGAMFLLAYLENKPIVGLPGCVMYAKRTVFDIVLPYLMADVPVTPQQLAALGHGGLCLQCSTCIFPACAFGAGV